MNGAAFAAVVECDSYLGTCRPLRLPWHEDVYAIGALMVLAAVLLVVVMIAGRRLFR